MMLNGGVSLGGDASARDPDVLVCIVNHLFAPSKIKCRSVGRAWVNGQGRKWHCAQAHKAQFSRPLDQGERDRQRISGYPTSGASDSLEIPVTPLWGGPPRS